jgi:hypothetical protein
MLIALLNAKAAEENRIAAIATLQQNVLQMQMAVASAQLQARAAEQQREVRELRSPVSPRTRDPSPSPALCTRRERESHARSHPYALPRPAKKEDEAIEWTPRRSWDRASLSDERSTSDDGASGRE